MKYQKKTNSLKKKFYSENHLEHLLILEFKTGKVINIFSFNGYWLRLNLVIGSMNVSLPYGLVVRITGFHPVGPGSIPGMGITF
jgi:hypothetical protein